MAKYKAHVLIIKGYPFVVTASQWIDELKTEVQNREEDESERCAVVTVEFEIEDSVAFPPETPIPVVAGTVQRTSSGASPESTPTTD